MHEPRDPVTKAVGAVERADDEPRTHVGRTFGEDALDHGLACGFQCAVVLHHLLGRWIVKRCHCRALVHPRLLGLRVDRHRRHEHVPVGPRCEQARTRFDDARHIARAVDYGVPRAGGQRVEPRRKLRVAITDKRGHAIAPRHGQPAAREDRHVIAAGKGRFDEMTAQETRAAKNEQSHGLHPYGVIRRSNSACSLRSPHASTSPPSWHEPPSQLDTTPPAFSISGMSAWMS